MLNSNGNVTCTICCPFLIQRISGVGFPPASHSRTTPPPDAAWTTSADFDGFWKNSVLCSLADEPSPDNASSSIQAPNEKSANITDNDDDAQ